MEKTINKPYVKKFNDKGEIVNPFQTYIPDGPNREERRRKKSTHRFIGNSAGNAITVVGNMKFRRTIQIIEGKKGTRKVFHYLPISNWTKKADNQNVTRNP